METDEDEDLPTLEPLSHREYIVGEIEHLADYVWPEELAQRLGYANAASLNSVLLHWGRRDLAQYFERSRFDGMTPARHQRWRMEAA